EPLTPQFVVRQDAYPIPVLLFQAGDATSFSALTADINKLKSAGLRFITLADVRDLMLKQDKNGGNIAAGSVALGITGITAENVKSVSDALKALGINATFFIETQNLGISGITERMIV